ncbi:hypothetical protein VF08_31250, partial [Nostoc linckia z8]
GKDKRDEGNEGEGTLPTNIKLTKVVMPYLSSDNFIDFLNRNNFQLVYLTKSLGNAKVFYKTF